MVSNRTAPLADEAILLGRILLVVLFLTFGWEKLTGYSGTVHFTSNDAKAVLPANYTFVAADAGARSFQATLSFCFKRDLSKAILVPSGAEASLPMRRFSYGLKPLPFQQRAIAGLLGRARDGAGV